MANLTSRNHPRQVFAGKSINIIHPLAHFPPRVAESQVPSCRNEISVVVYSTAETTRRERAETSLRLVFFDVKKKFSLYNGDRNFIRGRRLGR